MKRLGFRLTGSSIVNVVGVVIAVYLLIVLAETVNRNYKLNRQIHELSSEISLLQDQKDQLDYSIQYYKTDEFRDREARSKLGLQLPGENVVIIPRKSPTPTPAASAPEQATGPKSNFQQWMDFFRGRAN